MVTQRTRGILGRAISRLRSVRRSAALLACTLGVAMVGQRTSSAEDLFVEVDFHVQYSVGFFTANLGSGFVFGPSQSDNFWEWNDVATIYPNGSAVEYGSINGGVNTNSRQLFAANSFGSGWYTFYSQVNSVYPNDALVSPEFNDWNMSSYPGTEYYDSTSTTFSGDTAYYLDITTDPATVGMYGAVTMAPSGGELDVDFEYELYR